MIRIVAGALALAACGPPLRELVDQHHYREAVCGAHDGWGGDRELVGAALELAARPRINVYAIRTAELAPVLGAATDRIARRARFVRVVVATNSIPVDTIGVEVAVAHELLLDWPTLLALTGEPRPPDQVIRDYSNGGNALRGLFALLTFGAGLIPLYAAGEGFTSSPKQVPPFDEDYRPVAPHAYALHHELTGTCGGSDGFGGDYARASCTEFVALPPAGPAVLDVTLTFQATRHVRRGGEVSCRVERTAHVDLGEAAQLEATTDRLFGSRMRTLDDVAAEGGP